MNVRSPQLKVHKFMVKKVFPDFPIVIKYCVSSDSGRGLYLLQLQNVPGFYFEGGLC